MEDTKEKVLKVHIVHSVKGGSGKTAFSLFKAMTLANGKKVKYANKASVLYLDADFKGTAVKTLIYGKDATEFLSINGEEECLKRTNRPTLLKITPRPQARLAFFKEYQDKTLNDYLKGYATNIFDILVYGGIVGTSMEGEESKFKEMPLEARLDFIFSSPDIKKKKWFQHGNGSKSTPEINLGLCSSKMRNLLKQIEDLEYEDLVIDMPPGNDEYSSALLSVISEWNQKKKLEVYFYAITTNDLTHIDAEYEKFTDVLGNFSEYKNYERYIMVYNELQKNEFTDARVKKECEKLWKLLENISNNVAAYYTKCKYQDGYYKFCREAKQREFEYQLREAENKLNV